METVMVCGNKELKKIQELIEDDKEILLCYNKKLLKIKNMVSIEARTILCTIGEISKELIEHIDIVSAFIVASDDVKLQKLIIKDMEDEIEKKDENDMFS